jgi:hypothetical protein
MKKIKHAVHSLREANRSTQPFRLHKDSRKARLSKCALWCFYGTVRARVDISTAEPRKSMRIAALFHKNNIYELKILFPLDYRLLDYFQHNGEPTVLKRFRVECRPRVLPVRLGENALLSE